MEIIPVFFTFDKYYVIAAEVAIYSLLKHASSKYEYKLYILHTNISPRQQKDLIKLVNRFKNASLCFISTLSFNDDIKTFQNKSHFSGEIFFKLIAAEIFPQYDRIICSDVDVVFMDDISASYFMFPNKFFYFAGVGPILKTERMKAYGDKFTKEELEILQKEIAAGYLLINLKAIREKGMQNKLTDFYKKNYYRLCFPEQDCITLCCWPHIEYMPMKYIVCNGYYKINFNSRSFAPECEEFRGDKTKAINRFINTLKHPVQLHYVGPRKPWNSIGVIKQGVWFSYLMESGYVIKFIKALPILYLKTLRMYNPKRFLKKVSSHIYLHK